MKRSINRIFLFSLLLIPLINCEQQNEIKLDTPEVPLPEVAKFNNTDYQEFLSVFERHTIELSEAEKDKIREYTEKNSKNISSGRISAECNCPNQSSCSANCLNGDRCVCWSPPAKGACGCWMGFPSCKTEDDQSLRSSSNLYVTLYPAKIGSMLSFMDNNKMNTIEIKKAFKILLTKAVI